MPDIHWTGYIGMATGLFGSFLGIINYRKSYNIVKTHMRLDLKKNHSDLESNIHTTKEILLDAISSKQDSFDGATEQWFQESESAKIKIENIESSYSNQGKSLEKMNIKELEEQIHLVHNLTRSINEIREKYNNSRQDDKNDVEQNRRDALEFSRNRNEQNRKEWLEKIKNK